MMSFATCLCLYSENVSLHFITKKVAWVNLCVPLGLQAQIQHCILSNIGFTVLSTTKRKP